jgi:penicillin-binding protein 2
VALAVIVENAGWGAQSAAPIARRVFDYLLLGQYPNDADLAAVREGKAMAPVGTPRRAADVPLPGNALGPVAVQPGTLADPRVAALAVSGGER